MKKRTAKKLYNVLFFFIVSGILLLFFSFLDSRFRPMVKEISHMHCKVYVNKIIDSALKEILSEKKQNLSSFLFYDTYEGGYATDTMQVNQFCAALSEIITTSLSELPHEKIQIPIGSVFGSAFLADKGPKISFTLYPAGAVITNYESEFISAGINQVNYKIWLDISIELKIVNPLYKESLRMNRKLLLADIIFNGKVPEHYFQMNYPNEYLLTE